MRLSYSTLELPDILLVKINAKTEFLFLYVDKEEKDSEPIAMSSFSKVFIISEISSSKSEIILSLLKSSSKNSFTINASRDKVAASIILEIVEEV
ncbi:8188_t:CDS:2 [Funneliformis geosporum]|nr:8188_t:CDS:2 [Funneliformis geosporum]